MTISKNKEKIIVRGCKLTYFGSFDIFYAIKDIIWIRDMNIIVLSGETFLVMISN